MVELVDTQDLKSCDLKSRAGSIPALGTQNSNKSPKKGLFWFPEEREYRKPYQEITIENDF